MIALTTVHMVGTRNLNNKFLAEEDVADEGAGDQIDNNSLESDDAVVKGVSSYQKLRFELEKFEFAARTKTMITNQKIRVKRRKARNVKQEAKTKRARKRRKRKRTTAEMYVSTTNISKQVLIVVFPGK